MFPPSRATGRPRTRGSAARRLRPAAVLAALVLAAPAGVARSAGGVPSGFTVVDQRQIASGVEYLKVARPDVPVEAFVARIAAGAPVEFKTVSSHDKISYSSSDLELPSEMCRRVQCLVGVNGDFQAPGTDQPAGGVVSGGRLMRSPVTSHEQLSRTSDGRFLAGLLDWSAVVTASDGAQTRIASVNRVRSGDALVLYTPAWGPATRATGGVELVLRAAEPVGAVGRTMPVDLVQLRAGPGPIPADGAVLSGAGAAQAALQALWARASGGQVSRTAQLGVSSPLKVLEGLGGHPVLLRGGQRAFVETGEDLVRSRHPRTFVGWNAAGQVFLVTADGRRDGSRGMTLAEAADLLRGLGATEGINFDGGGGATFVVRGSVMNSPSDDGSGGFAERPAVNSLVVVAKPASSPSAVSPPTTRPATRPTTRTTSTTRPRTPSLGVRPTTTTRVTAPKSASTRASRVASPPVTGAKVLSHPLLSATRIVGPFAPVASTTTAPAVARSGAGPGSAPTDAGAAPPGPTAGVPATGQALAAPGGQSTAILPGPGNGARRVVTAVLGGLSLAVLVFGVKVTSGRRRWVSYRDLPRP